VRQSRIAGVEEIRSCRRMKEQELLLIGLQRDWLLSPVLLRLLISSSLAIRDRRRETLNDVR
jgi:hypothetical protein